MYGGTIIKVLVMRSVLSVMQTTISTPTAPVSKRTDREVIKHIRLGAVEMFR